MIFLLITLLVIPLLKAECPVYGCASSGAQCSPTIGCSSYNTYCSISQLKCLPLPGLNSSCGDPVGGSGAPACAPGYQCTNGICMSPTYFRGPGETCKLDQDCYYYNNESDPFQFTSQCINKQCYGPNLGEPCWKQCAQGFCNETVCSTFLLQGSVCNKSNSCAYPTECLLVSGGVKQCVAQKSVPVGNACSSTKVCAGTSVCNMTSKDSVGTCANFAYSATYLNDCTENSECSPGESCRCDYSGGKICYPHEMPYPDTSSKLEMEMTQCTMNDECYDVDCYAKSCTSVYCDYWDETMDDNPMYNDCYVLSLSNHYCTSGLSKGAKAGIAIGVILGVALIVVLAYFGYKRYRLTQYGFIKTTEQSNLL